MNTRQHRSATTIPLRRDYIQSSPLPVCALAAELAVSKETICRWKSCNTVAGRSPTAHHLPITLTPVQEAVITALRQTLWLSLDDLLTVPREFINEKVPC